MKNSRILFVITAVFLSTLIVAQESYNRCDQAKKICSNEIYDVNNIDANKTLCPNCEDDFNYCFTGENTIWFYFDTFDELGTVSIHFENLNFVGDPGQGDALQAIVLKMINPCISSSYIPVSGCEDEITGDFTFETDSLEPETRYYIVINGAMGTDDNAEAQFDLSISGPLVDLFPQMEISTESAQVCLDEPLTIHADINDCEERTAIEWRLNDELIATTADDSLVIDFEESGSLQASFVCTQNCDQPVVSNSLNIDLITFEVDAGPDFEITAGESVQLEGDSDVSGEVAWTPEINMTNPNVLTPFVSPIQTTKFFLSVTHNNCTITDFSEVVVIDALTIPNTFSPNGDGVNDTWEILGIENFPDCFVQVYNRWGQLVFQTTGYSAGKFWGGKSLNGKELAPSAYYYVINLRDDAFPEPLKGQVSIVR